MGFGDFLVYFMISCYLIFFSFQAALVSFATTGEKTVAAVLTCRSELVSTICLYYVISTVVEWICTGGGFHKYFLSQAQGWVVI